MAYVIIALFLIVPATGVAGAVLGWMALMASPLDTRRLKMAGWWLAIPWISYVVLAGPSGVAGGASLIFSPLVAVSLMAGWWWRSRVAPSVPQIEPVTAIHGDEAVTTPARPVATQPRGAISDLRLPRATQVALALAVTLSALWLITRPRRGVSNMGNSDLEEILTWAILFGAVVALMLAVLHLVRSAPALAAIYSTLALCVILGHAGLLMLGYWGNLPEFSGGHYALAVPLVVVSIAALIPAAIGQIAHLSQRRID